MTDARRSGSTLTLQKPNFIVKMPKRKVGVDACKMVSEWWYNIKEFYQINAKLFLPVVFSEVGTAAGDFEAAAVLLAQIRQA